MVGNVAAAAEEIWTAPETLDRIRGYVTRRFNTKTRKS